MCVCGREIKSVYLSYLSYFASQVLQSILTKLGMEMESKFGPEFCTRNLHIGVRHLVDDIKTFGAPSNWWCYAFERIVSKYVAATTNGKGLELTYARQQARMTAISIFNTAIQNLEEQDVSPVQVLARSGNDPGYVFRTWKDLDEYRTAVKELGEVSHDFLTRQYLIGVSVGVKRWSFNSAVKLDFQIRRGVRITNDALIHPYLQKKGLFDPSVHWQGYHYRVRVCVVCVCDSEAVRQ